MENTRPSRSGAELLPLQFMAFVGAVMLLAVVPSMLERLLGMQRVFSLVIGCALLMAGLAPVLSTMARSRGNEFRPRRYAALSALGLVLGVGAYAAIQSIW